MKEIKINKFVKKGFKLKDLVSKIPAIGKAAKSGVEAGGGFKGLKSAEEAYAEDKRIRNQKLQGKERFDNSIGIRDGVVLGDNKTLAEAGKDYTRGHYSLNELMNSLSKAYGIPKDVLRDGINAALHKESIEGFQKAHSDVQDLLGEEIQNASANGNTELVQKLQDLQKNFKGGKLSTSDINREIKNLYNDGKIGSGSHNDIIGKLNTIDNMLENDKYIQSLGLVNGDGGIEDNIIEMAITLAKGAFNRAEEKYKVAHENSSPSNQTKMDRYKEASDIIAKQYAFENGKPQGDSTDHYKSLEFDKKEYKGELKKLNTENNTQKEELIEEALLLNKFKEIKKELTKAKEISKILETQEESNIKQDNMKL